MTTVSIVIPYFNGMSTIERALSSVRAQSIKPAEIIVVNDGSDRENTQFLAELAGREKLRVIERPNGGQGAARNDGIRESATRYVCLLDQDDFYLPGHIEKLLDAANREDPKTFGFIYSDVSRGTADGAIVQRGVIAASGISHPLDTIREMLTRDIMILPSSMLLNREIILGLGGFDERFVGFEDDDLVIRCALAGVTSTYVPESLTVWTLNPGSASFSPRMAESRWIFFLKLIDNFGTHPDNLIGEVVAPRFTRAFIAELLMSIGKGKDATENSRKRLIAARQLLVNTRRKIPISQVAALTLASATPRFLLWPMYSLYSWRRDLQREKP